MTTQTRRNLLLALMFLAGCAASRVQWVPPALAQADAGMPRWDYYCMKAETGFEGLPAERVTAMLKTAGLQGWELVTVDAAFNYCFKRPLR